MSDDTGRWITTTEAAQRLGVKRATLYAYVSRGQLSSRRRPGQQESLFDRSEIDALATSTRPAGSAQPLLRFRGVATAVSAQRDGELLYRGVTLAEVARLPLHEAAALVLGDSEARPAELATADRAIARIIPRLPLQRRIPAAVQALAAADPFLGDLDPGRVRQVTLALVPAAVALTAGDAASSRGSSHAGGLAALTMEMLGRRDGTAGELEVLRVVLVALLDHGLTASTVAARVVASTRAPLHDCLGAAYAAMAGPLHGAAPTAAHALLGSTGTARSAVAAAVREQGQLAGFGHFLYPDGDPRVPLIVEALAGLRGTTRLRRRVAEISKVVHERTGRQPNVDLATAAVLHALDLPAAAGEVLFQVARSFGVAAHVVEEYSEQPLRWRGREAIG